MIFKITTLQIWNENKDRVYKESGISSIKQFIEILFWRLKGFNAFEYYVYPLYKYDPRPVLKVRDYDKIYPLHNPELKGVIAVDKWIQAAIWKANNIPHAEVLGFVKGGLGVLDGKSYDGSDKVLAGFLLERSFPLVIKPLDGSNGLGFDFINEYDQGSGALKLVKGGMLSLKEFQKQYLEPPDGILFQNKIEQHTILSRIFPHALNTIRVITYLDRQGEYKVIQGMAKFGTGNDIIDNNENCGILADVDIDAGCLGPGKLRCGGGEFINHPDTGEVILGVRVPFWKEVAELGLKAHRLIPSARYFGWDIAISKEGPKIIEPNSYTSIAVNQKLSGSDWSTLGL